MSHIVSLTGASVVYEHTIREALPYLPNERLIRQRYEVPLQEATTKNNDVEIKRLNLEMDTKVATLKQIKETIAGEI